MATPTDVLASIRARVPEKRNPPTTPEQQVAIATDICVRMASGELLHRILEEEGMPGWSTFWGWVTRNPEVATLYEEAREKLGQHCAAQVLELAAEVRAGDIEPKAASVAMNAYQWAAGKLAPKSYSERHQQAAGVQVIIQSTLALGADEGNVQDSLAASKAYVIDAHPLPGSVRVSGADATHSQGPQDVTPVGGPPDGSHRPRGLRSGSHGGKRGRTRKCRKSQEDPQKGSHPPAYAGEDPEK